MITILSRTIPTSLLLALLAHTSSAQSAPSALPGSQTTEDPQAISIIQQALNSEGGTAAITAIKDYTANGDITYTSGSGALGPIPISIRSEGDLIRIDFLRPSGTYSIVKNGITMVRDQRGDVRPIRSPFPLQPQPNVLPLGDLLKAVNNYPITVLYKGIVQVSGRQTNDVYLQPHYPSPPGFYASAQKPEGKDLFIDVETGQILMIQENLGKSIRQTLYSDFRPVNGVLFPYSMVQQIRGQTVSTITINQISINSGLDATVFAF